MIDPIYLRKHFLAIDYKFVFVVSRALFDLDYHSCSVNVKIVLKTKENSQEMSHN